MNTTEVRFTKGNLSMQDDYMDFINYVFGFNGSSRDFYKLLPKLYRPVYDPCASSYVVLEGERLKAAIGAFDIGVSVCGTRLKCRGIGNVAVHPFSRSKGYMKRLMEMSVDDMITDGVDFSVLGGRRQRYNYFSYDKGGVSYSFTVNADNMRHVFGKDRKHRFELKRLSADDNATLDSIAELSDSMPYHAIRERSRLYDILVSWSAVPVAAYENGVFAGYAVIRDDTVSECLTAEPSMLTDMIVCLYDMLGRSSINLTLPPFLCDSVNTVAGFSEGCSVHSNELYSVFSYERVLDAFLRLKASYTKLPDGELAFEIDGKAKKEKLLICVLNGVPSVTATERDADMKVGHIEAENLFFSGVGTREELPFFARLWFPLPIWMYSADMV